MSNQKFLQTQFIKGVVISQERVKLKNCSICDVDISKAQHQCKRCKRTICEKCGPHKAKVYDTDKPSESAHRLCVICKDEKEHTRKFIESFRVAFNKDSLAVEWLAPYQTNPQVSLQDYEKAKVQASKLHNQNEADLLKLKLENCLNDIVQNANYSLKELFMSVTQNIGLPQQRQVLERILELFLKLYPDVGYSPQLVVLTYFLLCFGSESTVFSLLTILFGSILPGQLYPKNVEQSKYSFDNEINATVSIVISNCKLNDLELNLVKQFLLNRIEKYVVSLGVNMFLWEAQLYVFNLLFSTQKNFNEFLRLLAANIIARLPDIRGNSINYDQSELAILRNSKLSLLCVQYYQCRKTRIEQFYTSGPNLQQINVSNMSFSNFLVKNDNADQVEFLKLLQKSKYLEEIIEQKDAIIQDLQVQGRPQEIGRLNNALAASQLQVSTLTTELIELQTTMRTKEDSLALEMQQNRQSIKALIDEVQAAQAKVSQLEVQLSAAEKENHQLRLQLVELNGSSEKSSKLTILEEQLVTQLSINEKLVSANLDLENQILAMKKQVEDAQKQKLHAQNLIEQSQIKQNLLDLKLEEQEQSTAQLKSQIEKLSKEKKELELALDEQKVSLIGKTAKAGNQKLHEEILLLSEINQELQRQLDQLDAKQKEAQELIREKDAANNQINLEIQLLQKDNSNLKLSQKTQEEQIADLQQQIKVASSYAEEYQRLRHSIQDVKSIQAQLEQSQKTRADLERDIKKLKDSLAYSDGQRIELERRLEDQDDEMIGLNSRLAILESDAKQSDQITQLLQQLEELQAVKHKLEQQLRESNNHREIVQEEVRKCMERIESMNSEKMQLEQDLENHIQAKKAQQAQWDNLEEQNRIMQARIEILSQEKLEQLNRQIEYERQSKDLELDYKEKYEAWKDQRESHIQKIAQHEARILELEEAQEGLQSLNTKTQDDCRAQLSSLLQLLGEKEKLIEEYSLANERSLEQIEELSLLKAQHRQLTELRGIDQLKIDDLQQQLSVLQAQLQDSSDSALKELVRLQEEHLLLQQTHGEKMRECSELENRLSVIKMKMEEQGRQIEDQIEQIEAKATENGLLKEARCLLEGTLQQNGIEVRELQEQIAQLEENCRLREEQFQQVAMSEREILDQLNDYKQIKSIEQLRKLYQYLTTRSENYERLLQDLLAKIENEETESPRDSDEAQQQRGVQVVEESQQSEDSSNAQAIQELQEEIERLQEKLGKQKLKIKRYEACISEIFSIVSSLPRHKQVIQFSTSQQKKYNNIDLEDLKRLLEVKDTQISQMKSVITSKQELLNELQGVVERISQIIKSLSE